MTPAVWCIVDVGHRGGATAVWRSAVQPDMVVCDRHRRQYDERDDLGPYAWQRIDGSAGVS